MRARFIKPIGDREPIELTLAISMGNQSQKQDNFKAFIDLINRHNEQTTRIEKLKIIPSDWLQRHYVGEKEARSTGREWKEETLPYLETLKIPYEVIGWEEITEREEYKENYQKVLDLYKQNESFQIRVENVSKSHAPKSSKENAINYLLEECAVFLTLEGHVTYPSNQLNSAVSFVVEHFKTGLQYHGYALYREPELENRANDSKKTKKKKSSEKKEEKSTENLLGCCTATLMAMRSMGLYGAEKQAGFFAEFVQLASKYTEESSTMKNYRPTPSKDIDTPDDKENPTDIPSQQTVTFS